jgi:hypothetical protein
MLKIILNETKSIKNQYRKRRKNIENIVYAAVSSNPSWSTARQGK